MCDIEKLIREGISHEGGNVQQAEVLGQGVEVVGAKGEEASFRYLGGAE